MWRLIWEVDGTVVRVDNFLTRVGVERVAKNLDSALRKGNKPYTIIVYDTKNPERSMEVNHNKLCL